MPRVEFQCQETRVLAYQFELGDKQATLVSFCPDDEPRSASGKHALADRFYDAAALPIEFHGSIFFLASGRFINMLDTSFLCFHTSGLLLYGGNKRARSRLSKLAVGKLPLTRLRMPVDMETPEGMDLTKLSWSAANLLQIEDGRLLHLPQADIEKETKPAQDNAAAPAPTPTPAVDYDLPELLHQLSIPPPGASPVDWMAQMVMIGLGESEKALRDLQATLQQLPSHVPTAATLATLSSMENILGCISADFTVINRETASSSAGRSGQVDSATMDIDMEADQPESSSPAEMENSS